MNYRRQKKLPRLIDNYRRPNSMHGNWAPPIAISRSDQQQQQNPVVAPSQSDDDRARRSSAETTRLFPYHRNSLIFPRQHAAEPSGPPNKPPSSVSSSFNIISSFDDIFAKSSADVAATDEPPSSASDGTPSTVIFPGSSKGFSQWRRQISSLPSTSSTNAAEPASCSSSGTKSSGAAVAAAGYAAKPKMRLTIKKMPSINIEPDTATIAKIIQDNKQNEQVTDILDAMTKKNRKTSDGTYKNDYLMDAEVFDTLKSWIDKQRSTQLQDDK